jgi:hypothetical protein
MELSAIESTPSREGDIMTHVRNELCFIAMPFGKKRDHETGADVLFDDVFNQIIRPAVEAAGLECIRADEEKLGGIIHKPMYERLLLCDYVVADITMANANVYYEVGIRHAFRPFSTVLTCAEGFRILFDLAPVRGVAYHLDPGGQPSDPTADAERLTMSLLAAKAAREVDSPLFQLCTGLGEPDRSSIDSTALREEIAQTEDLQQQIAAADSAEGLAALRARLSEDSAAVAPGVWVDMLVAYREHQLFAEMITLVEEMPEAVSAKTRVREQYALALNRNGEPTGAEQVIERLQREHGHSAESWGILGRIYKDRWEQSAGRIGGAVAAAAWLDRAIEAYESGFETDWRAHYPGINAVQLMWIRKRDDDRWRDLLPVVRFSAMQAAKSAKPHYWDFATLMEAAIYGDDMDAATKWLGKAITAKPKPMEAKTTLETIQRLRTRLDAQGDDPRWNPFVEALSAEASK